MCAPVKRTLCLKAFGLLRVFSRLSRGCLDLLPRSSGLVVCPLRPSCKPGFLVYGSRHVEADRPLPVSEQLRHFLSDKVQTEDPSFPAKERADKSSHASLECQPSPSASVSNQALSHCIPARGPVAQALPHGNQHSAPSSDRRIRANRRTRHQTRSDVC
ncbi:hypothetical protein VTK26DRAFT_9436 [Humicola hyalothermophila]